MWRRDVQPCRPGNPRHPGLLEPEEDEDEEEKPTIRPVLMGDKFERDPVSLKTFLYHKKFLAQPKLSAVQFEAVRYLETIYLPEDEEKLCRVLKWEPVRPIHFAALEWGKGSGKDHICCIVLARWVDRLLCLKNPQEYYGKAPQSFIHFLNIASSAGQASRAFFAAFRALVKSAECFQGQYTVVSGGSKDRAGGEPGKYEIEFAKQITAVSGHSGSASQEGLNLLGAIADEISEFRTKDEAERVARQSSREPSNTAESVIRLMKTSGRTRFPYSFKNAFLSYPRFSGDAIEQLVAKGQLDNKDRGEDSKWYVSGPSATWDVNPTVNDRAAFDDDYREDPAMAEAMYECKPGRATNRAFRNDVAIHASFARIIPPPLKVTYYWGTDTDEPRAGGRSCGDARLAGPLRLQRCLALPRVRVRAACRHGHYRRPGRDRDGAHLQLEARGLGRCAREGARAAAGGEGGLHGDARSRHRPAARGSRGSDQVVPQARVDALGSWVLHRFGHHGRVPVHRHAPDHDEPRHRGRGPVVRPGELARCGRRCRT